MRRVLLLAVSFIGLIGCRDENRPLITIANNSPYIIEESFTTGQTGRWLTEADSNGRTAIVNDQLEILIDQPNTIQYVTLEEPLLQDFDLSFEAARMEGTPNSTVGILFRMQSPSQFYRLALNGEGLYIIERHNADGSRNLLSPNWAAHDAILQGSGVANRVRIVAIGPNLRFFVNDVEIASFADSTYASGRIALAGGTYATGGYRAVFDNVVAIQAQ